MEEDCEQEQEAMPSPFPGMDPFLENDELWSQVHSRLIVAIADAIAPELMPNYYVAIEKRTYLSKPESERPLPRPLLPSAGEGRDSQNTQFLVDSPSPRIGGRGLGDGGQPAKPEQVATATLARPNEPQMVTIPMAEEVQERYLEIREAQTGQVVTAIELLSPTNKRAGEGREKYLRKRQQVLASQTHLVEIDLIQAGVPIPLEGVQARTDYRIVVSRAEQRPRAALYGFNVRDAFPVFALPLREGAEEPLLDLKPLLDRVYERAGYGVRVDYEAKLKPALSTENQAWWNEVRSCEERESK